MSKSPPQDQFCYSNSCWVSALAMMLSYRDRQSYSINTVLDMLGQTYVDKYKSNQGLTRDEFIQITTRLGLAGQSGFLEYDEIRDMLQKYGHIMIVDAENPNNPSSLHARLIMGVREDCTDSNPNDAELIILDPLDKNNGKPIAENFDVTSSKLIHFRMYNPKALSKKELKSFISCINTANKSQVLAHKVATNCLDTAKGISHTSIDGRAGSTTTTLFCIP
jgi:hypothetical protein